jgi:hypothetical protein
VRDVRLAMGLSVDDEGEFWVVGGGLDHAALIQMTAKQRITLPLSRCINKRAINTRC